MVNQKNKKKISIEEKLAFKFRGKGKRKCRFCGSSRGLIRKYNLLTCRRCFREVAERIGFRKY